MNLLLIMSDEHRRDAMGCMGHQHVKTPNLDRLAKRGTVFTNAYTPSPMCVPARAAIACGDYVHKTGYWDSATPFDGKQRSWMKSLSTAGVDTTSIGKLHYRSSDDDNGFDHEHLAMHVVNGVGWPVGLLRENPPKFDSAAELADDIGRGPSSYTDYDLSITNYAQSWFNSKSVDDPPWAAFVSLVSPHYPLKAPSQFFDLYDPKEIPLPVAYHKNHRPKHSEIQNIARFFNYDDYFDETKLRNAIVSYYALCTFMDDCVGRVLNALECSGQLDNTCILYVSDHGEMLGDHGLWTKQVMYEASAGVPMILSGPGVPESKRVNTATSLLDIYSTALDVFDLNPDSKEQKLPGDSLIKLANIDDDLNRTVLSEYHDGGSTTATFMVRWDQWKYVHYVDQPAQLFNVFSDPDELNDLTNSVSHKHILHEGEKRLTEICDPEVINQQCFKAQSKRIHALGGRQACAQAYTFNHTPTPDES